MKEDGEKDINKSLEELDAEFKEAIDEMHADGRADRPVTVSIAEKFAQRGMIGPLRIALSLIPGVSMVVARSLLIEGHNNRGLDLMSQVRLCEETVNSTSAQFYRNLMQPIIDTLKAEADENLEYAQKMADDQNQGI